MRGREVARLVGKDLSLMRLPLAAYVAAALVSVALAAGPPAFRSAGLTLALNVLIGLSFHVTLGPVLGEREKKTLAFVMSLPVRPRDAALAKLAAAGAMFALPGGIAAAAIAVALPLGMRPSVWGLVLGAWMAFFSIVLGAAIVTESIGGTIAALTGLIFVAGNVAIQVLPTLAWTGRYVRDVLAGGPSVPLTLGVEIAIVAGAVAATLVVQGRKSSFI